MANRDIEPEEEFYDGEEEFIEEEITPVDLRKRVIIIMTSSQGVSLLIHGIILLILASYYIYTPPPKREAKVLAKREFKEQDYDETLKRDLFKTPKIEADPIEKPIVMLEEEVEETKDIPEGLDLQNLSNKNLESTSVVDAYGVGGGAAGKYGQRWGKGSLTREGGSAGTESAVRAALRWLHFHQSKDGRWDCDGWEKNCRKNLCRGSDGKPGHGDGRYDVGVTALSLLAFLGHGQTHRFGKYKKTVREGLRWLKKQQKDDGSIGFNPDHGESIYNHSLAAMALSEAYAVSRDFTLRKYAQKAIDFISVAQNPTLGWKYGVKPGRNDTSVTGWMVLALKAAKTAELNVPKDTFQGALNWFDRATAETTGEVGYHYPGDGGSYLPQNKGKYKPVPTMTAVAIICRIFCGQKKGAEVIKKGEKILMKNIPLWKKGNIKTVNMYYWYYGSYAMFQYGGGDWYCGRKIRFEKCTKCWNHLMQKALLPTQRMGGCEDGSWDPVGEWGIAGGRVYAAAINCLTLEIFYRYARAQK